MSPLNTEFVDSPWPLPLVRGNAVSHLICDPNSRAREGHEVRLCPGGLDDDATWTRSITHCGAAELLVGWPSMP
jgi:hypothetical protein